MFTEPLFICLVSISTAYLISTNSEWVQASRPDAAGAADIQEKEPVKKETPDEGATIKGKIVAEEGTAIEFDLTTLEVSLVEHIVYKPIPLPSDWRTRTDELREAWIKDYQESDAGKEFFAEREDRLKNQRRFQLKLEPDGSFEVYDVPAGSYSLFGRKDVDVDGKKYAVEVFGQIELGDVDELPLQPLPIAVTRLLSAGEAAPDFSVDSLADQETKITLQQFQGRPILIYFWTMNNPGVENEFAAVKKAYEVLGPELKLELLALCVDKSADKGAEFVAAQQLTWSQGRTDGWEHPIIADFGLRAFPAYFLVCADGKLLMTNADFFREFADPSRDFTTVIREKVTGAAKDGEK